VGFSKPHPNGLEVVRSQPPISPTTAQGGSARVCPLPSLCPVADSLSCPCGVPVSRRPALMQSFIVASTPSASSTTHIPMALISFLRKGLTDIVQAVAGSQLVCITHALQHLPEVQEMLASLEPSTKQLLLSRQAQSAPKASLPSTCNQPSFVSSAVVTHTHKATERNTKVMLASTPTGASNLTTCLCPDCRVLRERSRLKAVRRGPLLHRRWDRWRRQTSLHAQSHASPHLSSSLPPFRFLFSRRSKLRL
jgi:hypothetical protein